MELNAFDITCVERTMKRGWIWVLGKFVLCKIWGGMARNHRKLPLLVNECCELSICCPREKERQKHPIDGEAMDLCTLGCRNIKQNGIFVKHFWSMKRLQKHVTWNMKWHEKLSAAPRVFFVFSSVFYIRDLADKEKEARRGKTWSRSVVIRVQWKFWYGNEDGVINHRRGEKV